MILVTQSIIQFLFIILIPGTYQIYVCNLLQIFLLFLGQGLFMKRFLLLKPTWFQFTHRLIELEGYLSVGTSHHSFLQACGSINTLLVILYNILGYTLDAVFIIKNSHHARHSLLASGNILFRSSFIGTGLVVCLHQICLLLVQEHTCQTRVILDRHSDAISLALLHGILIYNFSKHMHSFIDRCTGKT